MFNGVMSMSKNSYSNTAIASDYNKIIIKGGIYDILHIKYGGQSIPEEIDDVWQENTILLATFANSLSGGNIDIDKSGVIGIRIKRKLSCELGNKYITLFEKSVKSSDDLEVTYYDKYAKAGAEYTYAVCPVLSSGVEGELSSVDVTSQFCGIAICDIDHIYFTELETEYSFTKQHTSATVIPLRSRYPHVISNDSSDYWKGNLSAFWLGMDSDGNYDIQNQFQYREGFYDWLNNGRPKILKLDDGRAWVINITGEIQESSQEHWQKVITSFEWTEVGDCNSANDLYESGLTEVDPDIYRMG